MSLVEKIIRNNVEVVPASHKDIKFVFLRGCTALCNQHILDELMVTDVGNTVQ